jgi:hypothetical protein
MNKNHLGTEGHWTVGNREFKNKFQALIFATETNQEVDYIYFDCYTSQEMIRLGTKE